MNLVGTLVTASLMLRKLGSYPRQNGLALALRELGRIERTLFTLDWLQNIELRRRVGGRGTMERKRTLSRSESFTRRCRPWECSTVSSPPSEHRDNCSYVAFETDHLDRPGPRARISPKLPPPRSPLLDEAAGVDPTVQQSQPEVAVDRSGERNAGAD